MYKSANFLYLVFLIFISLSCGDQTKHRYFKYSPEYYIDNEKPLKTVVFADPTKDDHVKNQYIVNFKSSFFNTQASSRTPNDDSYFLASHRKTLNQNYYYEYVESSNALDIEFITDIKMTDTPKKPTSSIKKFLDFGMPLATFETYDDQGQISLVKFKNEQHAKFTLTKWANENKIWYAEPNYKSDLKNDEFFNNLTQEYNSAGESYYYVKNTNTDKMIELINSASSEVKAEIFSSQPIIAVLDSGFDVEHPALKDQVYVNTSNVGVLCKNDTYGCNTTTDFNKDVLGNGDVFPVLTSGFGETCPGQDGNCYHGTHVAGLAVGRPVDGGVYGTCPFCRVMPVRIVGQTTDASGNQNIGITDSSILRALQYVAAFTLGGQRVVRVINSSFGKYQKSRSVALLVRVLAKQQEGDRGVLLVGAASNENSMSRSYPAALADAVAVSAIDEQYRKSPFSNSGYWVDIAAPGSNILSSVPGGEYASQPGTSMASPIVAGVAGVIAALNPNMDALTIKSTLINNSNPALYADVPYNQQNYYPKPSGSNKNMPLLGAGFLDAEAAINGEINYTVPAVGANDRVVPGCSFISSKEENSKFNPLLLLLFLLPFSLYFLKRPNAKKLL